MKICRKGILFILFLIASGNQNSHTQSISGFDLVNGTRSYGLSFTIADKFIENQDQLIQYVHHSHKCSRGVSGESGYWFKNILTADLQLSFENTPENSDWIDWPLLYRFNS